MNDVLWDLIEKVTEKIHHELDVRKIIAYAEILDLIHSVLVGPDNQ